MAAAVSLVRPARTAQTVIPLVRGPEDRHFFTSFQDQNNVAFAKWSPYAVPPDDLYPLAPHRREVPLLDSTTGFRSVVANVGGPRIPSAPFYKGPGGDHRARTAIGMRPLLLDMAAQARWNSKSVSAEAMRARVGGTTRGAGFPARCITRDPGVETKDHIAAIRLVSPFPLSLIHI